MRIFTLTLIFLSLSACAHAPQAERQPSSTANHPVYNPNALDEVIEKVKSTVAQHKTAIVLFDLDDTALNTRDRTLRILRSFVGQNSVQTRFPEETKVVNGLNSDQVKYSMADSLAAVGIQSQSFGKEANDYWLKNFFTDRYCREDIPTPGARVYIRLLSAYGATLVFLSGRDTPRMGKGTADSIHDYFGYKPSNPRTVLMLKPDANTDDLVFKQQLFDKVRGMGEVVGAFENEPANINAMADAFPGATAIFLDTIHSPTTVVPEARVSLVKDFNLPERCKDGIDVAKDALFCK